MQKYDSVYFNIKKRAFFFAKNTRSVFYDGKIRKKYAGGKAASLNRNTFIRSRKAADNR